MPCHEKLMKMELPPQLQDDLVLIPWGNLFLQVIAKEIPESQLPSEKDEREGYPWSKAKKWSFANLNRLFSRYTILVILTSDMPFKPIWATR
jgi:hypothetical protein